MSISSIAPIRSLGPDAETHAAVQALPVAPPIGWYQTAKGAVDFILAAVLLALTAPLALVAILLVKLTSPGPAIYSQTRLGKGGRPFTIYKIRTMSYNCESLTGVRWSTPGDTRITPVGIWLRRTHLDELPQLWNVLMGDMSLIGPRPERPEFIPQLEQAIPRYIDRLQVKPGVTGLAQVQLPPDTDLQSVRSKLAYDLYYIQHQGPAMDLRIYAATFFKIFHMPFRMLRSFFGFPPDAAVLANYRRLVESQGVSQVKHVHLPAAETNLGSDLHLRVLVCEDHAAAAAARVQ